jgi:hypothetical protein
MLHRRLNDAPDMVNFNIVLLMMAAASAAALLVNCVRCPSVANDASRDIRRHSCLVSLGIVHWRTAGACVQGCTTQSRYHHVVCRRVVSQFSAANACMQAVAWRSTLQPRPVNEGCCEAWRLGVPSIEQRDRNRHWRYSQLQLHVRVRGWFFVD